MTKIASGIGPECDTGLHEERRLGHLSLRPSNQRMYSSSAMGDLLRGAGSSAGGGISEVPEVEGKPEISSSSVTTRPLDVISLLRMIRLCGKRPRAVCTCCLTCEFLRRFEDHDEIGSKMKTHSLIPVKMSRITL